MTWTEYARENHVTPESPYADIIDHLIEFYSETRPHASLERVEEWADRHAKRFAV